MKEWQSIETAPKDGRKIICFWVDQNAVVDDECYAMCRWSNIDGWVDSADGHEYSCPHFWMPLPNPPIDNTV